MVLVPDAAAVEDFLDAVIDRARELQILLGRVHGRPLKRRERFGDEEGCAHRDIAPPVSLLLGHLLEIGHGDLVGQLRDLPPVLRRLRGQTQHEIELDLLPSSAEGLSRAVQDLLLRDSLVYDVSEPLRARLRGKGQIPPPCVLKPRHDVEREGIDAERRQLQRCAARPVCIHNVIDQFLDAGIVAGTERAEGEVVLPCVLYELVRVRFEPVKRPLPVRPVDHARLAEAAASDAAPLDLDHRPVLRDLNEGHQLMQRIRSRVEILHRLLQDLFRYSRNSGCKGRDRSVLFVGHLVERRDIDAGHLPGRLDQELPAAPAGRFHLLIKIQQLVVDGLPFSDVEHVEELRDRLRIVGTGSPADDNRYRFVPLRGLERNPGQVQDLQHIRVAELKLQRDPQEIEVPDRILRLQCKKRDPSLPQYFVQVQPGGVHPLTPGVLPAVEHIV